MDTEQERQKCSIVSKQYANSSISILANRYNSTDLLKLFHFTGGKLILLIAEKSVFK